MSRVHALAAGMLLAITLVSLRAGALVCPSYYNELDLSKCHANGFCGWFNLEARRQHGPVIEEDDPPPEVTTLLGPWGASRNATIGSGDFFAIVDFDFDAGRSRVVAGGDARGEGPFSFPEHSPSGKGQAIALTRVTDLVFSGPSEQVETTLQLVFEGAFLEVAENVVDGSRHSAMYAMTSVYIGGGICRGVHEYVDFLGYHVRTLRDDDEGADSLIDDDYFLLEQVPLEGATELTVGPFTVPTREPLQLEFWIETHLFAGGSGGFARAAADFSLALGPGGGGPVFDLPPGYTADSPTAGIVANQVPEPGSGGLAGALGVTVLAWRRRRRSSGPA